MKSEIEVPNGWGINKLGDISNIFSGSSAPQKKEYFENGIHPFIRVSDLAKYKKTNNLIKVNGYLTDRCIQEKNLILAKKGTVVFPKSGAAVKNNNRAQLGIEGYIVSHLAAIKSKENESIDRFLYYVISNIDMMDYVGDRGYPSLRISDIKNIKIMFPQNLNEQQKIADILSKIDEQIDFTEKIIDKTEELKKGLMRKLLTKGIGHNGLIKIKIGINTYEIPEEWKIKTTKETLYMKGRIGWKGLKKSEFTKEGPFLITGIHFKEGEIDWDNCFHIPMNRYVESPEIQIKNNDVLLTKDGTIGKVAYVDDLPGMTSLNSHLLVLRPLNYNQLCPRYLYYVLRSNLFKKHVNSIKTGSTLAGLSQSNFGKFKYFIPSLEEQKQIASILSKVDEQIQDNKKELNHSQGLKKGLMQDLLTGKVRVSV